MTFLLDDKARKNMESGSKTQLHLNHDSVEKKIATTVDKVSCFFYFIIIILQCWVLEEAFTPNRFTVLPTPARPVL